MSRLFRVIAIVALIIAAAEPSANPLQAKELDRLSQMFQWWNAALKDPNGFTVESFSRYWDKDTSLVLNGKETQHGIVALTNSFKRIQAHGGDIEIMVPFLEGFQSGDRIFTHHIIRTRVDGKLGCMLVPGWARMKGDKIKLLDLVRVELDPATAPKEFQCWTE